MTTIILVVFVVVFLASVFVSSILKEIANIKARVLQRECEHEVEQAMQYEQEGIKRRYERHIESAKKDCKAIGETCKIVRLGMIGAIIVNTIFAAMYTVNEQETAVLNTFGRAEEIEGTGLHFKIPYIQRVTKVSSAMKGMALGYEEENNETVLFR